MKQNIVYVGIDVDDARYHGSALNQCTGEVLDFQCRATLKALVGQLDKVQAYFADAQFKLCYEASYVGFSLQRDLKDRGYDCEVVAPTSIPRRAGKSVKTDRIDATESAQIYANGLLTIVSSADAQVEHDRDLLRSRQQLMHQQGGCASICNYCYAAMALTTRPRPSARPTGANITTLGWTRRSNAAPQG
jgi:hypothetical protein